MRTWLVNAAARQVLRGTQAPSRLLTDRQSCWRCRLGPGLGAEIPGPARGYRSQPALPVPQSGHAQRHGGRVSHCPRQRPDHRQQRLRARAATSFRRGTAEEAVRRRPGAAAEGPAARYDRPATAALARQGTGDQRRRGGHPAAGRDPQANHWTPWKSWRRRCATPASPFEDFKSEHQEQIIRRK